MDAHRLHEKSCNHAICAKKTSHQHGKTFDVKPSKQTEKEATPTGRGQRVNVTLHPENAGACAAESDAQDASLTVLVSTWPTLSREQKKRIVAHVVK